LTPYPFHGFVSRQKRHGTEETIKSLHLERHTATEIVKLIKKHNLEEAVDLVNGGHHTLLFTDEEIAEIRDDYDAAKEAGMNLDAIDWYTTKEMESVSSMHFFVGWFRVLTWIFVAIRNTLPRG
jgi:hypothetical protein